MPKSSTKSTHVYLPPLEQRQVSDLMGFLDRSQNAVILQAINELHKETIGQSDRNTPTFIWCNLCGVGVGVENWTAHRTTCEKLHRPTQKE